MYRRLSAIVAAAFPLLITACHGGNSSGSSSPLIPGPTPSGLQASPSIPMPAASGATASAAEPIRASQGGSVALPDGTKLTFAPNVLTQDSTVQIAAMPNPNEDPASPSFKPIGSAIRITITPGAGATQARLRQPQDTTTGDTTLTFPASAPVLAALQSAAPTEFMLPIARIYAPGQTTTYTDISPSFHYDTTTQLIAADKIFGSSPLPARPTVIDFFLTQRIAADTPCGTKGVYDSGMRYYNPSTQSWMQGVGPQFPGHVLLLLHDTMSCVESTFSPKLVETYRKDGAYDTVIGFDYNWFKSPKDIAPEISFALNGNYNDKIDIFAHGYGAINALATIPLLKGITVENMVLYDGLLNGAFINSPVAFQTLAVKTPLVGVPDDVATLGTNSMLSWQAALGASQNSMDFFTPDSQALKNIKTAFMQAGTVAHVIKITGDTPLKVNGNTTFVDSYKQITGSTPAANDGVVLESSALDPSVQGSQPQPFPNSPDSTNALTSPSGAMSDYSSTVNVIKGATHLSLLSTDTPNLYYQTAEQMMSPLLSFETSNASAGGVITGGRFSPNDAQIIMKGKGTRTHITDQACPGVSLVSLSNNDLSAVTETFKGEACSTNYLTLTEQIEPAVAPAVTDLTTGQITPTVVVTYATAGPPLSANILLMPPCTSCLSSSSTQTSSLLQALAFARQRNSADPHIGPQLSSYPAHGVK